jgi:ATP-binding cassette, subfamily B, bacterial
MSAPSPGQKAPPSAVRALIREAWPSLRKKGGVLAGAWIALLAETAFRLLEPWPLKWVFDKVLGHGAHASVKREDAPTLLVLAALALVGICMLRALAAYLYTLGFAQAGNRLMSEIRQKAPPTFEVKTSHSTTFAYVVTPSGLA